MFHIKEMIHSQKSLMNAQEIVRMSRLSMNNKDFRFFLTQSYFKTSEGRIICAGLLR